MHLLGSLQLALLLLATIALACAVATVAESRFDTTVAHTWIYKAPWFMAWLTVLCINLFAVTLTRWPWKKKHAGFIITHYGIILLLLGAIIGMTWGFEGNVTLHRGTALTKITTRKSVLQIESPSDTYLYLLPYDATTARPSLKHPTRLSVPGTELQLIIDDWSRHLVQQPFLREVKDPRAPAALLLELENDKMHQKEIVPLTLADAASANYDFFGLATLQFFTTLPPSHSSSYRESQLIAAHFPPVTASQDRPSGVNITLSDDGDLVTIIPPDGKPTSYSRRELMHHTLPLDRASVTIQEYWPDFKLLDGRPTTASQQPNNPALRAEIVVASTTTEQPKEGNKPWLHLALAPDIKGVQYQLGRGATLQTSGTLEIGATIPLGWGEWKCRLLAAGPHEEIDHEIIPMMETRESRALPSSAPPGFHAYLNDRNNRRSGPAQWVISGAVTSLHLAAPSRGTVERDGSTEELSLEDQIVRVGYGLELRPLSFSIELLDFEVPRDEGTETPSDFRATVRFKNLKTGVTKEALLHMNHPASFPGTFWSNLTGINYKFSQAEWNPNDLQETTLQVLYDPGWLFKWIGSLAICIGIAMMFYFAKRKK